jgi:predicted RNase H-like nuclease
VTWVLGLDVCPDGWAGVAWDGSHVMGVYGSDIGEVLARSLESLSARGAHGPDVVGIDIPIGLPDRSVRAADIMARREVGRLASSVFTTPIREAVEATEYADALGASRSAIGLGLSRQAFGLREKILQVDVLVRGGWPLDARVAEVHPEVSFAEMAGEPLGISKHRWGGAQRRRALLAERGLDLEGGDADVAALDRHAGVADVLDAAAVAWTAMRIATGRARCLPDPPEVFSDGWPAAIWV